MALGDWTSTFETLPPDSETAGLGDDRIRTLKAEIRTRGAVVADVGGASIDAAYGDTGKMNPGTGRIYRATGALPTTYLKPDATAQAVMLGVNDTGHMVLDQRGWADALQMWDGGLTTPGWVNVGPRPSLIRNGAMRFDQRRAGVVSSGLTAGTRAKCLDGWAVTPTGSSAGTVQQVTSGLPTGAVSKYGLKVVGAAALSNVDIDQRVEARDCAQWGGYVTVRVGWIYVDGAAGTITPSFRVDTAGGADNWGAPTNRLSQAFPAAATGGYFTHTFDLSALTNYANGCQFVVRCSGATDLDAATKSIVITDFDIVSGQAPSRRFIVPDYQQEYENLLRFYQKSFAYATAPAQNWIGAGSGGIADSITIPGSSATGAFNFAGVQWHLNPPMRIAPAVTTYNPRAANANATQMDGAGEAAVTVVAGAKSINFNCDPQGLANSDQFLSIGAVADAEL